MKKIMFVLMSAVLALSVSAAMVYAEDVWECTYEGTWSYYDGEGGEFYWDVTWTGASYGWDIVGDYYAEEGNSWLDGSCSDGVCEFTQTYQDGDLEGNVYSWIGSYEDEWLDDNTTVNYFQGTWGYDGSDSDGGTWEAVATCERQ